METIEMLRIVAQLLAILLVIFRIRLALQEED